MSPRLATRPSPTLIRCLYPASMENLVEGLKSGPAGPDWRYRPRVKGRTPYRVAPQNQCVDPGFTTAVGGGAARLGNDAARGPEFDRLAACHAHMARQCGALVPAIDHEIMPFGLACDRLIDGGVETCVAFRSAQRTAQVGSIALAEAHIHRAGTRDAHAVARFAEIVGERRNKAQPPSRLFHAHVTRWAARVIVNLFEGESLGEPSPYDRERQIDPSHAREPIRGCWRSHPHLRP